MQRITGHIAQAREIVDDRYMKKGVHALTDNGLKKSLCVGSYYKGCSKCVCYDVCEYGKEAVFRGLRK